MPWETVEIRMAEELEDCNPALDFVGDKSIVTIRVKAIVAKQLITKSETKHKEELEQTHYSLLYNGNGTAETFWMNEKELISHKLFYDGKLDISGNRWSIKDMEDFKSNPSSIPLKQLYELIWNKYNYYYEFEDERFYWIMTIFTIYSYFFPIFSHAPILQFFGEFRTGKTKLCQLIEAMAFNPLNSSNISASTVFRTIQAARSLIILDESEDLTKDKERLEIVNMLLSGTNRSGKAYRQEKSSNDNYQTKAYHVFGPKIIANITGIGIDSLQSRIIRINTSGTVDKEKKNRDVDQESNEWQDIRNQLYRLALTRHQEVRKIKDTLAVEGLSGRWYNMWFGLLVISRLCSEKMYENMLTIAIELSEEAENQFTVESPSRMLIQHLINVVKENGRDKYTAEELYKTFDPETKKAMLFESKKSFGLLMIKIGLKSKLTRTGNKVDRLYTLSQEWLEKKIELL